MPDDFYKPQIQQCSTFSVTLALPEAGGFECYYCGKHLYIPPELWLPQATYEPRIIDGDNIDSENCARQNIPAIQMGLFIDIGHPGNLASLSP
jgi:hypothetical protein